MVLIIVVSSYLGTTIGGGGNGNDNGDDNGDGDGDGNEIIIPGSDSSGIIFIFIGKVV